MKKIVVMVLLLLVVSGISLAGTEKVINIKCYNDKWETISGAKIGLVVRGRFLGIQSTDPYGAKSFKITKSGIHQFIKDSPAPRIYSRNINIDTISSPYPIIFVDPNRVFYSEVIFKQAYLEYLQRQLETDLTQSQRTKIEEQIKRLMQLQ